MYCFGLEHESFFVFDVVLQIVPEAGFGSCQTQQDAQSTLLIAAKLLGVMPSWKLDSALGHNLVLLTEIQGLHGSLDAHTLWVDVMKLSGVCWGLWGFSWWRLSHAGRCLQLVVFAVLLLWCLDGGLEARRFVPKPPKTKVCTSTFRWSFDSGRDRPWRSVIQQCDFDVPWIISLREGFGASNIMKDMENPIGRRRTNLSRFTCWMAFCFFCRQGFNYITFHRCYKHLEWNVSLC